MVSEVEMSIHCCCFARHRLEKLNSSENAVKATLHERINHPSMLFCGYSLQA